MPPECAIWNCRWLVNDDTADLPRPDRAHYVIDLMPDFITIRNDETGENQHIQVVQVSIDPKHASCVAASDSRRGRDTAGGAVTKGTKERKNHEIALHSRRAAMREPERIVRLKTVLARTGLSRSTIYRKIAEGTFPAQLKISTNGTGWHESDINRWIADPVSWRQKGEFDEVR